MNAQDETEHRSRNKPWVTGDPIPDRDRERVRDLIYAGFSRRRAASKLGLHKDLVGEVFDEYAPRKQPDLSEEKRSRVKSLIEQGASLPEIASAFGVSVATARVYAAAVGVHPRTLTPKYIEEKRKES